LKKYLGYGLKDLPKSRNRQFKAAAIAATIHVVQYLEQQK
jgi:hypothetical protein